MEKKEVQKSTRTKNLNLFIVEQLKIGVRPTEICKILSIKKSALSYHLSSLKKAGIISKVGYGVWKVLKDYSQKEVQKSTVIGGHQRLKNLNLLKPDSVRGHAFMFKFELPKNLRNWEKREEIMQRMGLEFEPLLIGGIKRGQKLIFRERRVWLTNKSIVIHEEESFISDLAHESRSLALNHFMELLKGLERHLQANFQINRSRFKVSRQHYALIKNALAKQYDKEGNKLECYTGNGLWLVIDNSLQLHECETVHPKTAVSDNEKIQNFFNGVKTMEGFTPQFVVNSLANQSQNIEHYAIHLKTHVESVQKLGSAVEELTEVIKKIKNK